jgi:flagellar capping protein FliD
MATSVERLGIVETKVENLSEKLDDLKVDVKDMHDCLDQTRDALAAQLKAMADESDKQHAEIAKKISAMEKLKDRWTFTVAGVLVAVGWISAHGTEILKIIAK